MLKAPTARSIRSQLLAWLLVPLCSLWLLTTSIAYFFASEVANSNFDRELLNSADSIFGRVRVKGGLALIDITPAARAILRHNNRVSFFYQVTLPDGSLLSGDPVMPKPNLSLPQGEKEFAYANINGEDVRTVLVNFPDPRIPGGYVLVQAAETLQTRKNLADKIQAAIVVPQLILIIFGAAAISFGVARGLSPLRILRRAVGRRSPLDLSPISESDTPVEVRPLVHAINDLLQRLREDLESQRRFVANAAHQLRTPLAGLKTYIGFGKRMPPPGEMHLVLDQLDRGTDRMTHLVNRLLSLAKAEPATREVQTHCRIDLNSVASESTSEIIAESIERDIDLSFEGSAEPAYILGDAASLKELVSNLVENAVRYTQPGGAVTVRVVVRDTIKLIVEDNGPGIPVQERDRVFERFYRILGSDVDGCGLGLSIVSEIAHAHDARVSLSEGAVGHGTMVTIDFHSAVPDAAKLSKR